MCNQILDPGFVFDLNSIRVSICNRLDILREASVEIVFFRQVRKSSDPASLTFCCGGIFLRRPTIFGHLVDILADYRLLQKHPE